MLVILSAILGLLTTAVPAAPAEASEMMRTSPSHMSGTGGRSIGQGFSTPGMTRRTQEVNPPARGIMAIREQPLSATAEFDPELSALCQSGDIRRFGGGVVTLKGRNYAAALPRDIRGKRPALDDGIYIFRFEGSSACQVYVLAG